MGDVGAGGYALGGGVFSLLGVLFVYMLRQLRHNDHETWRIIADRDKRIEELIADRDYWRNRVLGSVQERRENDR